MDEGYYSYIVEVRIIFQLRLRKSRDISDVTVRFPRIIITVMSMLNIGRFLFRFSAYNAGNNQSNQGT